MTWVRGKHVLCFGRPDRMWVILGQSPLLSITQSDNRKQRTSYKQNKEEWGNGGPPLGSQYFAPDDDSQTNTIFSGKTKLRWGSAEGERGGLRPNESDLPAAWLHALSPPPGQHFLVPTPRQQKARTAEGKHCQHLDQYLLFAPTKKLHFQRAKTCNSYQFDHQVAPLALVKNMATR